MKYQLEKRTGILLQQQENSPKLTYRGASTIGTTTHALLLRFEAALPCRNLFSLDVESTAPQDWTTKDSLLRDSRIAFAHWISPLECCNSEVPLSGASPILYDSEVRESARKQEQANNLTEAPAPIAALQAAILAALRQGDTMRTSDHCGTTNLFFDGNEFVREDCGECPQVIHYPADDAILTCLRNFYDYPSRSHCFPHRPPELDVWLYIQRQLRH